MMANPISHCVRYNEHKLPRCIHFFTLSLVTMDGWMDGWAGGWVGGWMACNHMDVM